MIVIEIALPASLEITPTDLVMMFIGCFAMGIIVTVLIMLLFDRYQARKELKKHANDS